MVAVSLLTITSNGLDETTLNRGISLPGVRSAFVNVRGGGAVDQETEQFRPAVVAAQVHQLLALVNQGEVEVAINHAFSGQARPSKVPSSATIALKEPPEIGLMLPPVSLAIFAC